MNGVRLGGLGSCQREFLENMHAMESPAHGLPLVLAVGSEWEWVDESP